jgi:hypothetical protein
MAACRLESERQRPVVKENQVLTVFQIITYCYDALGADMTSDVSLFRTEQGLQRRLAGSTQQTAISGFKVTQRIEQYVLLNVLLLCAAVCVVVCAVVCAVTCAAVCVAVCAAVCAIV